MSLIERIVRSVSEKRIISDTLTHITAITHVKLISTFHNSYIIEQFNVEIDISHSNLPYLRKYRMRKGSLAYEQKEAQFINMYLEPNTDVIDLGAGVGFTSCCAAMKSPNGKIIAVEAVPDNINYIIKNSDLNGVSITPVSAAYSPTLSEVSITIPSDFRSTSEYEDVGEKRTVSSISLTDIVEDYDLDDFTLICDIEGSEEGLIEEIGLIEDNCRMIIIEMHEDKNQNVKELVDNLEESGFELLDSEEDVRVYINEKFNNANVD